MEYSEVKYAVSDRIATITLNRPEKLNAFTVRMLEEWADAIHRAREDADVGCVVVTGAGRGFCSGMDLGEDIAGRGVIVGDDVGVMRNSLRYSVHEIPRALQLLDKPYIAAVNGPAIGAGMDMASMADIRVCADTARFAMSYVRIGVVPGDGGAYFLPRIVGTAKALELIWTGKMFGAEEAIRIGYVTAVYPNGEFATHVTKLAQEFATGPSVAIQISKHLVYRSLDATLYEALDLAQEAMFVARATDDAKEGPRAFVEKRAPQWHHR